MLGACANGQQRGHPMHPDSVPAFQPLWNARARSLACQAPLPCAIGWYQPAAGQASCLKCPAGTTTKGIGSADASACVAPPALPGSYSDFLADAAKTGPGACEALITKWYLPIRPGADVTELLLQVRAWVGAGTTAVSIAPAIQPNKHHACLNKQGGQQRTGFQGSLV